MLKLFASCQLHSSAFHGAKIGHVMKKVMGQTCKKKRIFSDFSILPSVEVLSNNVNNKSLKSARRVTILNKLFMKNITDLLGTSEYSSEFTGLGIEITRVEIIPDYTGVNVFWTSKNSNENVEKILKKNAGFLRHELSSLRIIGNVPRINFVKDKESSEIAEIDLRLARADFGNDYESLDVGEKIKKQVTLYTNLIPKVKEKLQRLETNEGFYENLPKMPNYVFGLDHSEIMKKIKQNIRKSKALHRIEKNDSDSVIIPNKHPVNFGSKEKLEAFQNFLEKRELMRTKLRKLTKKCCPHLEYSRLKQEFEERQNDFFAEMKESEEEDYLEEDDKT